MFYLYFANEENLITKLLYDYETQGCQMVDGSETAGC